MSRAQRRAIVAKSFSGKGESPAQRHGSASILSSPAVTEARESLGHQARAKIFDHVADQIDDALPLLAEEVVEKHVRTFVEAAVVSLMRGEVMGEIVKEAVRLQIYSIATGEALSRVPEITARVRALVEETIEARVRSQVDKAVEGAIADVKRRLLG